MDAAQAPNRAVAGGDPTWGCRTGDVADLHRADLHRADLHRADLHRDGRPDPRPRSVETWPAGVAGRGFSRSAAHFTGSVLVAVSRQRLHQGRHYPATRGVQSQGHGRGDHQGHAAHAARRAHGPHRRLGLHGPGVARDVRPHRGRVPTPGADLAHASGQRLERGRTVGRAGRSLRGPGPSPARSRSWGRHSSTVRFPRPTTARRPPTCRPARRSWWPWKRRRGFRASI